MGDNSFREVFSTGYGWMNEQRYFFSSNRFRLEDGLRHNISVYYDVFEPIDPFRPLNPFRPLDAFEPVFIFSSFVNIWKFYSLSGAANILSIFLYFYENTEG